MYTYTLPATSNYIQWPFNNTFVTTSDCTVEVCNSYPEKVAEKETAMSYDNTTTDYLARRIESLFYTLRAPLTKTYNLYIDNKPKTYKDLIDAIKNDKFTLDAKRIKLIEANMEDEEDGWYWYGFNGAFDGIIWNGPQPDHKGYEAAIESLSAAKTAAMDIIKVSTDEEKRLAALKAFEAWKPTVTVAN